MTDGKVHLYDGKVLNENGVVALCDGDCCPCTNAAQCISDAGFAAYDMQVTLPLGWEDEPWCGGTECDDLNGAVKILTYAGLIVGAHYWTYSSFPFLSCSAWDFTLSISVGICCDPEPGPCREGLGCRLFGGVAVWDNDTQPLPRNEIDFGACFTTARTAWDLPSTWVTASPFQYGCKVWPNAPDASVVLKTELIIP